VTAPPPSTVTTTAAVGTTLLTYQLLTEPNPLTVSASSDQPTTATLTFSVSCSRAVGECTVSEIGVVLPVGDASDSAVLTPTAPPNDAASISSSDGVPWTPSPGIGAGVYRFAPSGGSVLIADQALTIAITGIEMSTVVGTADIVVTEWAAPGTAPAPSPTTQLPSGRATIAVPKFPAGFSAGDFTSTTPDVGYGEPATLTWVGSDNASFQMAYGDVEPFDVAGYSWTSRPLYDTTRFILTASASEGGQTVALSFDTSVGVDAPTVVQFDASPNGIDVGQALTLSWRAVDADGVYLYSGDTERQSLPAVSDPANAQLLTPANGVDYTMVAYQQGDPPLTSPPWKLDFHFNPIRIASFGATPASVDATHPQTQVSWEVYGAVSVAYEGNPVAATDSATESPTEPTNIYNLVATWVDGTTQTASVTVPAAVVDVEYYQAVFDELYQGAGYDVTLTFHAQNVTGLTVSQPTLLIAEQPEWNAGVHFENTIGPEDGVQAGPSTWTVDLFFWGACPTGPGRTTSAFCSTTPRRAGIRRHRRTTSPSATASSSCHRTRSLDTRQRRAGDRRSAELL
jgi:hypothetical protein